VSWPLLLDLAEAAEVLRSDVEHVERLIADGRLRTVRLFPDEPPRVRPEDLVEVVEQATYA
jgi:hypothetical protein